MALMKDDRCKETSTTIGTSSYVLLGAVAGFQSFATIGNTNTVYYCATDDVDWEVGLGTYSTTGPTLARTTILSSSNADAAVSWGVGTRKIFNVLPASKSRTIGELVLAADLPAATTTAQGASELLTTTELLTGTDTTRAATADSIAALWEAAADITDGATINLGEGGYFNLITSTTTITAFTFTTDKAGRRAVIRTNTARQITHNGTSLICPNGENIRTSVGEVFEIVSLGGGNVRVLWRPVNVIAMQVFTATGASTYTPTVGMRYCIAIITGGGGGGGNATANPDAGSGGGAGGTAIQLYSAATIGASQTVTIGGGGPGGSPGTTGTTSTFGALMSALGGVGGEVSQPSRGGTGGVPTGGLINITGGAGASAQAPASSDSAGGNGGASFWGGGGEGANTGDTAGGAGLAYGSGGGGASTTNVGDQTGGTGKDGVCLVIEFA